MKTSLLLAFIALMSAQLNAANLNQSWLAARQHSATHQAASFARLAAQELPVQAKAQLLPQIEASAQYQHFSLDKAHSQNLRVQLSQPLFNRPRWEQYETAQISAQQAESEFQAQDSQLLLNVGKAYLAILVAEEKLHAIYAEQSAYEQQIQQAQALFSSGQATILDTYEAQAGLDAAKAKALQLKTEQLLAQNQFADLTGLDPQDIQHITTQKLPDFTLGTTETDWIEKALKHNAALKTQQLIVEKSLHDVKTAQAQHLPQLNLNIGYQDKRDYLQGRTERDHGAYIGISFTIPIFSGGETSSRIRQQEAIEAQQKATLESQTNDIRLATKQAWANLKGQQAQIQAQEQLLNSNAAKLKATRLGRTYGIRHSMDEIQAEQAYAEAQEKLASARYGYIEAWLTLLHISGELVKLPDMQILYSK